MKFDMSQEKEVKRRILLPVGWRKFLINDAEEAKSKAGNDMIIFTFIDEETKNEDKIYAVTTQGKRFFLKKILDACGLPAAQDGVYEFELNDLIGKTIAGKVEHEENEWINREGETVKTTQHRITTVDAIDNQISWDD